MSDVCAIIAIVERGRAEEIVKAARAAGARGATVSFGRGTSDNEIRKFLHINVESSKEIILILTKRSDLDGIFQAVVDSGKLEEEGKGIAFVLDVPKMVGRL